MDEMLKKPEEFRPSRALVPFAVFFLLLVGFIVVRLISFAPLGIILGLMPFVVFALWWFIALFRYAFAFSVTVSDEGIRIVRPGGGLFSVETALIGWPEIRDIAFSFDKEFNPKHFTARNTFLTLHLADGKTYVIEQVTILENYGNLFSLLQQKIPFSYQLPVEHLWSQKTRVLLVVGAVMLFGLVFILFMQ